MRIGVGALLLHTQPGYAKAGIGRYVAQMLAEFVRDGGGHSFVVFVPTGVQLPDAWRAAPHMEWREVPFGSRRRRLLWEHFGVRKAIRGLGLDLYFSTAQSIPFPLGIPRTLMLHDVIPALFPQYYHWDKAVYQKWCMAYAGRHADLVFTNSEATMRDVARLYGTPSERFVVTPLGPGNVVESRPRGSVGASELRALRVPFERFLFSLSTLEPRKNFESFIPLMERLREHPRHGDVGLVIGGGRGWKDAPIFARVQAAGLESKIQFLGYVEDEHLPALFAACEAFVFPSWYEGFGITVLEAMLLGAPVASSDRGSLREVGGDGCVYFDPADADDMHAKVVALLDDSDCREAMVRANFERAARFTWRECARLTLAGFDRFTKA